MAKCFLYFCLRFSKGTMWNIDVDDDDYAKCGSNEWKKWAVTDDCACFLVAIWQQSAINFKQYKKDHIFIWMNFFFFNFFSDIRRYKNRDIGQNSGTVRMLTISVGIFLSFQMHQTKKLKLKIQIRRLFITLREKKVAYSSICVVIVQVGPYQMVDNGEQLD